MRIRPARSADAEAIAALLDELGQPRIGTPGDDPASAAYVADAHGELLGVIAVQVRPLADRDGTRGRIVALVVADRARGRGIGSRLVAAAESFATIHGCLRMEYTSCGPVSSCEGRHHEPCPG